MFDTADEHLRVKNRRAAFWTDRDIVPKHKSWHTTQRMWCAEKWTRLSKLTLLLCVVWKKKKKSLYSVHSQAIKMYV